MAHQPDETVSLRTWIAVLGTILGAFMAVLDNLIANASPRMTEPANLRDGRLIT